MNPKLLTQVARRATMPRMQEIIRAISELLESRGRGALATVIETGGSAPQIPGARLLLKPDGGIVGTVGGGAIEHRIIEALRECMGSGIAATLRVDLSELGMCCGGRMTVFIEPIESLPGLVLFGAGHVGLAVAKLARTVGFAVTVVDERAELNTEERFPGCRRICCSFKDSAAMLFGSNEAREAMGEMAVPAPWFLIMTHDHSLDEAALELCLGHSHSYLGMIGSQRKVLRIFRSLAARAPLPSLERVYAPVGLDLGGDSPEELAVSIIAELLAVRHGRPAPHLRLMEDPLLERVTAGEVQLEDAVKALRADAESKESAGPIGGEESK